MSQKVRIPLLRSSKPALALFVMVLAMLSTFAVGIRSPQPAIAATSNGINFQARLMSNTGGIVPDGYYNVEFKIYNASSGGTLQFTDTYYDSNGVTAGNDARVRVANGYLTVSLGSQAGNAFPSTINWDQQMWITMNIGGTTQTATPTWDGEMSPRLQLTAVPYAFRAGQLAKLAGSNTGVLQFAASFGQDSVITLPDPGASTATVCYQNAVSCGFLTGTAGSYIQNQNASAQTTSNFWISGTGRADTAIQAPLFDTGTGTSIALALGTTNATAINLNQNTTVLTGKTFTVTSGATSLTGATSGDALTVSNSTSTGNVAVFKDNTTAVLTIADGGAVTMTNSVDSSAALRVANAAGGDVLSVNTTNSGAALNLGRTGTPAHVATAASGVYGSTSTTSRSFTFARSVPIGHSIVGSLVLSSTATTTLTITDTAGNTYTTDAAVTNGSTAATYVFSANVTNAINSGDSLNISAVSGTGRWVMSAEEFGNLVWPSAVDKTSTNSGSSTSLTSGATATTTQANEMVFGGFGFSAGHAFSAGSGFTAAPQLSTSAGSNDRSLGAEWLYVTSTGAQTATGTLDTSASYAGAVVTYKSSNPNLGALAGTIRLADIGGSAYHSTLNSNTLTADRTISLPDEAGTICIQNSANCGFATGTSGSYIQNTTTVQSPANFAIRSAAAGSVGGVIQGFNGQTADLFDVQTWNGTSATTVVGISNTGLLTASAGLTAIGTVQLNATGSGATTIGNSTAGALTVASGAASSIAVTGSTLSLSASNFSLNNSGVLSLIGGQTQDITTPAGTTATGLTVRSGASNGASSNGGSLTLGGGDASGTTNVTGGSVSIQGGNATGASGTRNGGSVTIDGGTSTASAANNGAVNLGTTNASAIGIGHGSITTTVTGSAAFNVASASGITVTSDLSTGARSTPALLITQANDATNSNSSNLLKLQNSDSSSTAAALQISNVSGGKSINLTGTTTGTAFDISGSNLTSGTGINTDGSTLTSGSIITLGGTNAAITNAFTGSLLLGNVSRTLTSGSFNDTGNFINMARSNTVNNAGSTFTVSGALVNLQSSCTQTAGTCTDTSNILNLNQQYANASGTVLNVQGAGTGNLAVLDATNAAANGMSIDVQASGSTKYALSVTSNNGGTTGLYVRADGNVGIGNNAPSATLEVTGTVKISTLGSVSANSAAVCRDTSTNQLTACDSSNTTGRAFLQGGNSFGATGVLGTSDANNLQIITGASGPNVRATFDTSNNLYLGNGVTANAPNAFTVQGTGSATAGVTGALLTIKGGAGASVTTGGIGGGLTLAGGDAGGSGNNAGGTVTLQGGNKTNTGAAGKVLVKNMADSASAFSVQNAAGTSTVLDVDTTSGYVGVGTAAPSRQLHVSVNTSSVNALPVKVAQSGTGDTGIEFNEPAEAYYLGIDSTDHKFKLSSDLAGATIVNLGYNTIGGSTDSSNSNTYEATKFTAGATGTVSTVYGFVGAIIGSAPNNKGQAAIYSDSSGSPGTRLGYSTGDTTLTANAWNAFPITGTSVTSGTVYWLVYNTNGTAANQNDLKLDAGAANQTRWSTISSTYGTWATTWPGNSGASTTQFSLYAPILTSANADNFLTSLLQIGATGQTVFQNSTDSSAAFQVQNAAGTSLVGVDTASSILNLGINGSTATASTVNIATSTGATQTIAIGGAAAGSAANGTNVLVQGGNGASAVAIQALASGTIAIGTNASNVITIGNTSSTGQLTLGQSSATNTISIGSANFTAANTQTINIANGSQTTAASTIAVNILSGAAGNSGTATLSLANNDRVTQVDIGNVVADANRTLNVFSGNTLTGTTDTINIGTGNTAGTGAKVIHIGDGTPVGTNTVTVGSIAATGNVTTIQGGNTATGNGAISIQAAASGVITIGTVNNNPITIGGTSGTTTLQGTVKVSTVGAVTSNSATLCRDTSTFNLTSCDSSNTTGRPFLQGGNNFGATGSLGTLDNNSQQIITNNIVRATFDTSNNLYLGLGATAAAPTNFTVAATGSATAGTNGANLKLQGGAGASATTGSAGGVVTIQGGNAGGSGNNAGGNIVLNPGTKTNTGAAGTVLVQPGAAGNDSTALFSVKNAAGTSTILDVDSSQGYVGINTAAPTADLSFGQGADRTVNVQTRSSNAAGNALTLQAGNAGAGAAAFNGGNITLQAGDAGGTGAADGGNVYLKTGLKVGGGEGGQIILQNTGGRADFLSMQNATGEEFFHLYDNTSSGHYNGLLFLGGPCCNISNPYQVTLSSTDVIETSLGIGIDTTGVGAGNGKDFQLAAGSTNDTNMNGGSVILTGGNKNGTGTIGGVIVRNAADGANAFRVQNNAGTSDYVSVNSSTGAITLGTASQTGTITVGQSSSANTINIGNANFTAANAQTINIANGSQTTAASTLAVNILSGAAGNSGSATLSLGNNDRVTQVDIGNVAADANRTLNLFTGNTITGTTDTINLGTGNTVGTGAKVIHIGDGTPAGTNTVTVGSIAATANVTTVQGGNGSGAVSIQAASSGTINIATVNNNQLTLGGSSSVIKLGSLGSSTAAAVAVCRDSSTTNLISCASGGTGAPFLQGGNNFGATGVLGTTDANNLQIVTGSGGPNVRATFDTSNNLYLGNGLTATAPNNFVISGTGSATAGTNGATLTVQAGAGSSATTGSAGGDLKLQGGNAAGSGNNAGGNVILIPGTATNTGTKGTVQIGLSAGTAGLVNNGTTVNTVTTQSTASGTAIANQDLYSAFVITVTNTGQTMTLANPSPATAGRTIYISNASSGSNLFTLAPASGSSISLNTGATATLMWNGSAWTYAGADASSVLNQTAAVQVAGFNIQPSTNVTAATITGAASSSVTTFLVKEGASQTGNMMQILDNSSNAYPLFTVSNTGSVATMVNTDSTTAFQVQNASGATQLSLDTTNTGSSLNLAATNGGGETSGTFTTQWPAAGLGTGVTVSRDTTAGEFASGVAGVKVISTTGASSGADYVLPGGALSVSTTYIVSFSAKLAAGGTPSTFTDLDVRYNRAGTTQDALCTTGSAQTSGTNTLSTRTLVTTGWTKVTCSFVTSTTAGSAGANLAIIQTAAATTRTWYIDNLSIVAQAASGTQNTGTLRVGGASSQGLTLFTLDTYAATPFSGTNASLAGSMYFDTTQGKIQCYDGTLWGACGAAPNSNITLTPEYAGAVLHGTGIGTLTSDFCGNGGGLSVNTSICASGEARNYYNWTSVQASSQAYSMYVTYKLPSTFKAFVNGTTTVTARTDNTSNASASYKILKSTGGTITSCSSSIDIVGGTSGATVNTWTPRAPTTDPSTCSFGANNYVIIEIDVNASNSANVQVENLNFSFSNQ
ncbi:MAG TPA: hypothetical protein VLH86_02990 [Patescibacteria group bacterium]|nr:hypothetical protein [Patescibacteria group bacterium]